MFTCEHKTPKSLQVVAKRFLHMVAVIYHHHMHHHHEDSVQCALIACTRFTLTCHMSVFSQSLKSTPFALLLCNFTCLPVVSPHKKKPSPDFHTRIVLPQAVSHICSVIKD